MDYENTKVTQHARVKNLPNDKLDNIEKKKKKKKKKKKEEEEEEEKKKKKKKKKKGRKEGRKEGIWSFTPSQPLLLYQGRRIRRRRPERDHVR